jgi:GH43 family beta-xylosidase
MRDAKTGKLLLYYADIDLKRMWFGEESIYVQELGTPTAFSEGSKAAQMIKPDQRSWEFFRSSWIAPRGINEGPWVIESGGKYVLMYSGAGADTEHYNLGIATSDSATGPFEKNAENPISVPKDPVSAGVFGPGHHSVWEDRQTGKKWAFYHRQKTAGNGWNREICVDQLVEDGEGGVSIEFTP